MSGRLVLALDTATSACSVALLSMAPGPEGNLVVVPVAVRVEQLARSTTRRLLVMVEECLHDVGAQPDDLGAVVVGVGPGTFTGVRIGVATARAAAFALAVPIVGISTLAALAAMAARGQARVLGGSGADGVAHDHRAGGPTVVVPVCDARRGQLFAAFYEWDPGAGWRRVDGPVVVDPAELTDMAAARADAAGAVLVGDTSSLTGTGVTLPPGCVVVPAGVAAEWLVDGQELLSEPGDGPAGNRLGPWLCASLVREAPGTIAGSSAGSGWPGAVGTPESVVPLYVRTPDADIHITKMRDPWAT